MREILFRGKRCDNLDWVEGYLLKECNYETCSWNLGIEYKTDRFGRFAYEVAEVVPYTVGQFTGLTDKNGKKIFERDIIRYTEGEEKPMGVIKHGIYRDYHVGFFIEWGESQPCLRRDIAFWATEREIEVIGNIHDNPELLGGENDG